MAGSRCKGTCRTVSIVILSLNIALCIAFTVFGSYLIANHVGLTLINATITSCSSRPSGCIAHGGTSGISIDVAISYIGIDNLTWYEYYIFDDIPCDYQCPIGPINVW